MELLQRNAHPNKRWECPAPIRFRRSLTVLLSTLSRELNSQGNINVDVPISTGISKLGCNEVRVWSVKRSMLLFPLIVRKELTTLTIFVAFYDLELYFIFFIVSEQQIIDCSLTFGNYGCAGGSLRNTLRYIEKTGGLMAYTDYPYASKVCSNNNK